MEYGHYSLYPPLIAILAAFITRKIIPSLLLGIVVGTLITSSGNIITACEKAIVIFWKTTEFSNFHSFTSFNNSWHLFIILFCCTLGIIINLINYAGGAQAYGEWALARIKSRVGASLSTMAMGIIIFFDDYFNCLTVGAVMRPVTDRFKISRAKLAYIIDSTTAPVCILAPVSSWVIYVISQLKIAGIQDDPYGLFLQTIVFNFYAWLALLAVCAVCIWEIDFGPMKEHEQKAKTTGDVGQIETQTEEYKAHGTILDLFLPITLLIALIIGFMLYTGDAWIWGGQNSTVVAFQKMNAGKSMFWGGLIALILIVIHFIWRKLINLKEITEISISSLKTMFPVVITLILAWSIGTVIRDEVKTGKYLAQFLDGGFVVAFLPAIIFLLSCIAAFATGSSWGTFAIMIPIAVELVQNEPQFLVPVVGAVLAGAIYGDHTSPISDTTILSSIGAGCEHIDHVTTQAPYSSVVAVICLLGFIITGCAINMGIGLWIAATISLGLGIILLALVLWKFRPLES